ncbi:MAG: flagellar hook protein [Herbaspirillum sp.]|jgi:flagellar hook-associated protein 2|nr:flagellar hook protein [Herbaspirillum sp.]
MSTGALTSSGAGQIDVQSLVSQIMANEAKILTPLTTLASSYNAQLSAYGSVKSALTTYQAALASLTTASFSSQQSTIVNNGTGTSLSTGAFTATVNPTDTTTAKAQILTSAGVNASNTIFQAGDTLAFKIGTNSPAFITLQGNATLSGVADQINAANKGVVASVTTDDQGSHLVLESATGGAANTLQVSGNGSLSQFAYNPSAGTPSTMTVTQAAQDPIAAISGSYSISVNALAQGEKLKSAGFSTGQTFNTGILAIKSGTNATVMIKPANNTLAGIRDAINSSASGVNATIVQDGTLSHLVLTSAATGATSNITVTGTGDFGPLSTGSWSNESTNPPTLTASTMTVQQPAQDASVVVDGVAVTSSSNTITTAIPGVTLNLTQVTTPTDSYNMSISNDTTGIQTSAQKFVDAYNALIQTMGPLTAYDATTQSAGALQGDSTANSIENQIRNALTQSVGSAGALQTLNDVGISLQKDGTLALDTTKLTAASTTSFNDISKLLTASPDGIVTQLNTLVTGMLAAGGLLTTRTDGITTSLKLNSDQQTQIQSRLTAEQANYTAEFNALNVTLSNLQSQQAQLTSALAGLASTS